MIINRKEKTCILTPEDEKEIGDIDDYVVRPIVDSMMQDINEDLDRWVKEYEITDDETEFDYKRSEEFFKMAYEMFESYYYTYIKQCVIEIVMKTKVI